MKQENVSHYIILAFAVLISCCLPQGALYAQDQIGERQVGTAVPILDFEQFGTWRRGDEAWGTFTQSAEERSAGSFSGKFSYAFPAVSDNYIVFRQLRNISGQPDGLRIQVYGNGSTHFLNVWVQDANNQLWQFTFGRIEHVGWHSMFAPLDLSRGWPNQAIGQATGGDLSFPIRLAALILDGHSSEQGSQGAIYVDDLEAITFIDSPQYREPIQVYSAPSSTSDSEPTQVSFSGFAASVTVNRLNVRRGPGLSYAIIDKVSRGDTFPVVEQDESSGWLQIVTSSELGWVADTYVSIDALDLSASDDLENFMDTALSVAITPSVALTPSVSITPPVAITPSVVITPSIVATPSVAISSTIEVSPSGRIAFPSYAGGSYAIYLINADGTNLQRIIGDASQPALNVDGTRMAFRNWREDKRGVAIVEITAGEVQQLSGSAEDALPAWAPNEDTLAYFSRREGDRRPRIYQVSASNRNEWQLEGIGGEFPVWMPDGRILYRATRPQIALTIMDNDGANPLTLIADGEATAPSVSPNGQSVLFMSRIDGDWEIYQTDVNGRDPIQMTDNSSNDGLPVWSPDGQHIAFVTDRDGYWAIWLMDPNGADQRELLVIPGTLDARMLDEPIYSFRGWLEERISWSE